MIVNPRVFNYRLTIGTLLTAIALIVVYGFSTKDALDYNIDFLEQEKELLQTELKSIINKYDQKGSEVISLKSKIEDEKALVQIAQESIQLLKVDLEVIPRYRNEIVFLNRQNKKLKAQSFVDVADSLKQDNVQKEALISLQENVIVTLEEDKVVLEEALEKAKLLYANSLEVNAFRVKKSGQKEATEKAKNAAYVEVCFVIGKNPVATKGLRELYIQVLGPDNNIVADKGAVNFGKSSLIYSSKINFNYKNNAEEICAVIENDDTFKKGTYYVSVFEKDRKLGYTQIDLY